MRYLKSYEQKSEPQIGDWIAFNLNVHRTPNLGKIEDIKKSKSIYDEGDYISYLVIVEGEQDNYVVSKYEIRFHSPNKEDCEAYIAGLKYNL